MNLNCEDAGYMVPIDRLNDEVLDNIKCILEHAGLWNDNMDISLAPIPNDENCDEETGACLMSQDFTIYGDNGNEVVGGGTAVTKYFTHNNSNFVDVSDTEIFIPAEWVRKIYEYVNTGNVNRRKITA